MLFKEEKANWNNRLERSRGPGSESSSSLSVSESSQAYTQPIIGSGSSSASSGDYSLQLGSTCSYREERKNDNRTDSIDPTHHTRYLLNHSRHHLTRSILLNHVHCRRRVPRRILRLHPYRGRGRFDPSKERYPDKGDSITLDRKTA